MKSQNYPHQSFNTKVTIVPASTQTSRATIQELLEHPLAPTYVGVYRSLVKVPTQFQNHPKFQAVQGDLTKKSLDFSGTDAAITLTPPKYDGSDYISFGKAVASRIRDVAQVDVKRVVYVSRIGAQHSKGIGEIRTNHNYERISEASAPEVVLVRNADFTENWVSALETIKADPPHFYSTTGPFEYELPMVSTGDMGRTCAKEALRNFGTNEKNPRVVELHGPKSYSAKDVKGALEKVTGKEIQVRVVEKDDLPKFFSAFLPKSLVPDFVEMTEAAWPGGLLQSEASDATLVIRGEDTLISAFSRMLAQSVTL